MSEAAWRLILVGSVASGAVLIAAAAFLRQRLAADRAAARPVDLAGIVGSVLFFSEASCRSCDSARARLQDFGVEFTEIRFEERPDAHLSAGVESVPLIVVRADDGSVVGQIVGNPSRRRLYRLIRGVGNE
ncbi:MAG: hypothetical protein MUP76_01485 [Acidimicrobiia bacterium]|nr:hypothetical protein [Acidimicrobiia bacterium]